MIGILKINEPRHLTDYQSELVDFFILYEKNFPDDNEREDPKIICDRIRGLEKRQIIPETTILLSVENQRVLGGCVVEYYTECQCMLLTYIVVDTNTRGKGVSRKLIDIGIKELIETKNNRVKALFFESNIPWETIKDSFNLWDRFAIFSRLGAKWIDINYVQPPLEPHKNKVKNLFLFTIPHLTNLGFELEKPVLTHFLEVFYKELGISNPYSDEDFLKMTEKIASSTESNSIMLKEVPRLENDFFNFSEVSIAFHIADYSSEKNNLLKSNISNCHIIGSYEFDLLQYRFQKASPFHTHVINNAGCNTCKLFFTRSTQYVSEGRYETVVGKTEGVEMDIRLNCTVFGNNTKIWTLVLSPANDGRISQDEIIRVISLFANTQERNNIKSTTKIVFDNKEYTSFEVFAQNVCGVKRIAELKLIPSGILQFDAFSAINQKVGCEMWERTLGLVDLITRNDIEAYNALESEYLDPNSNMRFILNLLCGFSLGIFDYSRMSFEEVMDTLKPVTSTGHSFIVLNKGILLSVGYNDDMYRKTRKTIGLNPYLLISSAVLAFNDMESLVTEQKINSLLNLPAKEQTLSRLIKERKELERKVNNEILINVFHYQTERSIFDFGMSHRGINGRIIDLRNSIQELGTRIEDQSIEKKAKSDLMITILLAAISVLSLEQTFTSIFSSIHRSGSFIAAIQLEGDKWLAFSTFSVIAILLTTHYARKSIRKA